MKFSNHRMHVTHGSGNFKLSDFNSIGQNVIFEKGILVFHPENISIGNNVYIGHNTILKGYFKNEMIIGDHTWIGQGSFFHAAGGIRIGKAVGIGPMTKILTSTHLENDFSKPILFHDIELNKVTIEDGSDIGIGSIILPGTRVGQGSIIGAGSVVTKDILPFSVAAGNPAKLLRAREED